MNVLLLAQNTKFLSLLCFVFCFFFLCLGSADTRQITSPNDNVRGEIKLSVQYHRGALTVMVNEIKCYTCARMPKIKLKTFISDLSCTIVTTDNWRTGAKHLCESIFKARSNKINQTQNQSRSQKLLSKFYGNGKDKKKHDNEIVSNSIFVFDPKKIFFSLNTGCHWKLYKIDVCK